MEIREMRPWFWILVAALALVAVGALVVAISASNESVDQKQAVDEATKQIKGEVSGLDKALQTANELQAEGEESAAAEHKRIRREVEDAVARGEAELHKVRRRVRALEGETTSLSAGDKQLEKSISGLERSISGLERSISGLTKGNESLESEVEELDAQVTEFQKALG